MYTGKKFGDDRFVLATDSLYLELANAEIDILRLTHGIPVYRLTGTVISGQLGTPLGGYALSVGSQYSGQLPLGKTFFSADGVFHIVK